MYRARAGDTTPPANPWPLAAASVLLLAAVPALLCGIAYGEFLRRRRLAWTWTLLSAAATAPLLAVFAPPAAHALVALARHPDGGLPSLTQWCDLLWPFWLAAVSPIAARWKAWRDHRARLQGGHAERNASHQLGPVAWLRRRRRNAAIEAAGPVSPEGVYLGVDEHGDAALVPPLLAHATIVGGSGTGKTNTAEVLLEAHVADGAGFVVLDGKGGRSLARTALQLGARYGRPVALWSVIPYGIGAEDLDSHRLPWNVTGDGNPTEIKDRIASTEEQTEPYYAAVAARGLLMSARALQHTEGVVRLDALAGCLENQNRLSEVLKRSASEDIQSLHWLNTLDDAERSGLRGMGLRLRTMVSSDGGEWLLPSADGREISLYRAIKERWLVVFTLPQGLYPELIPHVTRYVLQAINSVCTRMEAEGTTAYSVLFVDELSAFEGDELAAAMERARSAGVRVVVATQSLSNFDTVGGTKLLHAALDDTELLIIHCQSVPDAAEQLAGVGGTTEGWEHTHQVQDRGGFPALGIALGRDESGQRARRLTDHFIVHPNTIKRLTRGQAVVISKRPTHSVRVLQIRPGLTAR
jgi:hypothetical protein